MATATDLITAEEFERLPSEVRAELIHGEIVDTSPNKSVHGLVERRIAQAMGVFADHARIGIVMSGDNCFLLERDPDLVRCPDVSFVSNERVPKPFPTGFFPGPPDIAVEIVSPSDRASDISQKIEQWLRAGTVAVWLVDPQAKSLSVHSLEDDKVVGRQVETFLHEELLPGFELSSEPLFELLD